MWAWLKELFKVYKTEDYINLVGEWLAKEDRRKKEGKDA